MTSTDLEAGGSVESAVRQRYLGWARAGLDVVRDLASRPERVPSWPQAPRAETESAAPRWFPSDLAEIEAARKRGWLVSTSTDVEPREGALSGLAIAVKDNIDVVGLPTRNGTPGGQWRTPAASAPAWDALAQQGARCAGKSAMHEMAWGVTTATVPGPIDAQRIAGGSSGGSAAIVAVGATRAALGTDTGGSIRIPAALCGVVGMRPTHTAISTSGVTALAPSQDVVGPITDRVEMAALVFEKLTGTETMPAKAGVWSQRIGYLSRLGRVDPAVDNAYRSTLAALAGAGAVLVEIDTVLPRLTASVSLLRMLISSEALHGEIVRRDPLGYGPEARALLTLSAELTLDSEILDRAANVTKAETAEVFAANNLDVLLSPTCPCLAPARTAATIDIGGRTEFVDAALTRYAAWAAVAGLPAVSVPAAGSSGLPVGIQIMAAPGREDSCIRTALTVEEFTPRGKGK